MSARRPNERRRRLTVGVAALVCAAVFGIGMPAVADVADDAQVRGDPDVLRAETDLEEARGDLDALGRQLDEAAAAYEHAAAHHLQLVEEAAAAADSVQTARERTATARVSWGQRIADAYKRPETDVSLGEAIIASPDAATAVHRAALVSQVTTRGRHQVAAAQRLADTVTGEVRQQHVIGAGTAEAAADLEVLAERLERLVASAGDGVRDAQRRLTAAEEAATKRIEARRRAAAEAAERARVAAEQEAERKAAERRQAAQRRQAAERAAAGHRPSAGSGAATAVSRGPVPAPVAGKVCPVGNPHGFIDSWGFPRSGGRRHQGVDIFAARGTPLYAVADGVISRVGSNSLGGLVIDLIDDDGDRYYYAHLSAQSARQGQRVRAGDVIGAVGNTGNARTTPPHLHWQYHPGNGAAVNPYPLAAKLCKRT